jgi:hypothetical protein
LPLLSGSSLQKQIIPYPAFVISVPQFYSMPFQENYQKLKEKTGCTDIAIRLRKDKMNYHHFTVCCKGTLEACQKLEEILTPILEYDETRTVTFAEMKELKTKAMQHLLRNVFGFDPPTEAQLPHSKSTPGRDGYFPRQASTRNWNRNEPQMEFMDDHGRHYSSAF